MKRTVIKGFMRTRNAAVQADLPGYLMNCLRQYDGMPSRPSFSSSPEQGEQVHPVHLVVCIGESKKARTRRGRP